MTTSSLAKLEQAFSDSIEELGKKIDAFPWHNRQAYTFWVAQTYYLVRHTTRLVALAAAKCSLEDEELHKKCIWHLREEVGHEQLAVTDLKSLGVSFKDIPELPQTTAIYQSQYFFVEHYGPHSQLGYSMLLEGLAAKRGRELSKKLADLYGDKAMKFMRVHAEEDEGHLDAGLAFMAKIAEKDHEYIRKNLELGKALYGQMLDAIMEATSTAIQGKKKAA